jgi:hypothetical protein
MKTTFAMIATAAMVLGLSGSAFAQGVQEDAMAKARAEANLDLSYETMKDRPFGDIPADVNMAAADRQAWMGGLSPEMQGELAARCDIIQQNADRFEAQITGFCASLAIPPADERPSELDVPPAQ